MAVYEGARQRQIVLPRRPRVALRAPVLPRRRTRAAVRARRGPSRISIVLAVIVVGFSGAFFSLSQDVMVSATGYKLDQLSAAHFRLEAQAQDLYNELNRLGRAPAIRKQAIDAGLGALPEPLIIPAR
jgi:hypothetical protein